MRKLINAVVIGCMSIMLLSGCTKSKVEEPSSNKAEIKDEQKEDKADVKISLAAVGDNLIHGAIFRSPDYMINGGFDFRPIYSEVKTFISSFDIANINQETILGGSELGLSHYPCFNSPHEIGDAVVDAGFDWISQASNHCLDSGVVAIESAMNYWDTHPEVVTTGINRSEEEAKRLRIKEVKGIKIGLLNYSYGFNGFSEPADFYCNEINKEKISKDYQALKAAGCKVVLASMHWGEEYQFASNAQQQELAQYLADLGVNVIIGSHPHVVQESEFLTGKNGNQTLVNYSLGNFISAQDVNYRMLGAMMTCDIVVDGNSDEVRIEQAKIYPTVTYFEIAPSGMSFHNFKVYFLKDYNNTLAQKHGTANTTKEYLDQLVNDVYKEVKDIEIVH